LRHLVMSPLYFFYVLDEMEKAEAARKWCAQELFWSLFYFPTYIVLLFVINISKTWSPIFSVSILFFVIARFWSRVQNRKIAAFFRKKSTNAGDGFDDQSSLAA
jgi:hypothetical protein